LNQYTTPNNDLGLSFSVSQCQSQQPVSKPAIPAAPQRPALCTGAPAPKSLKSYDDHPQSFNAHTVFQDRRRALLDMDYTRLDQVMSW
jgi:hypothetical protein